MIDPNLIQIKALEKRKELLKKRAQVIQAEIAGCEAAIAKLRGDA